MMNIVTVHWVDPKWIAPQHRAFEMHFKQPYRVYGNLERIDSDVHDQAFYRVTRQHGTHAEKLNALADMVVDEANADDLLIFIDGDAFPVRDLDTWIERILENHPLAAVRRAENAGDVQPHPCFCVTTVGFWNKIRGDWREGPTWENSRGEVVTDVGASLMAILADRDIQWQEILRTNAYDLHPVLFGIYGGHIYHHGAGFRTPLMRIDGEVSRVVAYSMVRENLHLGSLLRVRPHDFLTLIRAGQTVVSRARRSEARKIYNHAETLQVQSDLLFEQICADPSFHSQFEDR